MEMINRAFFRALSLHVVMCAMMIVAIIGCVFASKKRDSMAIYAIVIGIFLVIYCATSVYPVVKDCILHDVIQVEAIYVNALGDKSKSTSSILGEYSVVLETHEGDVSLTTVPFSKDMFPAGEYAVTAWYSKSSKRLLYIEIHDVA